MQQQLLKPILTAAFVIFGFANVTAQTTFSTGLEGWSTGFGPNDPVLGPVTHAPTEGVTGDGALQLARETNNSNFGLASTPGIDANTIKIIKLVYKNGTNGYEFRVQGSNDGPDTVGDPAAIAQTIYTITANSTEWKTAYIDMTGVSGWANNIDQLDILVRRDYAAGEGVFLLDEVEFLESIPATFSGIVQNPSFEDSDGAIAPWNPANKTYATVAVTSDDANSGTYSMTHTYSAVPGNTHFVFNNYIHDLGATFTEDITASLWVKVVRPSTPGVSPIIEVQGQSRTGTTLVVNELITQGQNKMTTKTDGTWEEITYSYTPAAAYSTAQFRYGLLMTNLQAGDIVYVDDLFANLASLSVAENTIVNVSLYPNPASGYVNIKSLEGANVEVYNIVGKLVKLEKTLSNNHSMDVSDLSAGVYLVKLTSNGKSATKKLIIK